VLEVLAQSGALVDLVATGARIVEPDLRVISSEVYPPPKGTVSLRTADPEPGRPRFVVGSAETLAYAVATGTVGDPRSFKRPVRVTVPRALPTDDVLVLRDKKGTESQGTKKPSGATPADGYKEALNLEVLESAAIPAARAEKTEGFIWVLDSLDAVRRAGDTHLVREHVRGLVAVTLPRQVVTTLASEGIACFLVDDAGMKAIKGQKTLSLPPLTKWGDGIALTLAKGKAILKAATRGVEAQWLVAGTSRPASTKKST
jgi:aconitate hydratase